MIRKDDPNPFEHVEDYGWSQVIKFQEFSMHHAGSLLEYERRKKSIAPAPPDPSLEDEETDEDDEFEDERDALFKIGQFLVNVILEDDEQGPTAAQIRALEWLNAHRTKVARVLIDHAYTYYNDNIDGFRDFFNREPQDRDLLLPKLTSPQDLKRVMRLMEIDIQEETRDGLSLVTFQFDTTWDLEAYWNVTLCGDQIVDDELAPFPFTLSKDLGWEKLPSVRGGRRFAEFLYRDHWTGVFEIDPQGACRQSKWCPVCQGPQILDPELITAIRQARPSHMIAAIVSDLGIEELMRPIITIVVPISLVLGWSWNSACYWGAIAVSLIAVTLEAVGSGYRRSRWTFLGLLEAGLAGYALLPKRAAPRLDEAPNWTLIGFLESSVWLCSAAMAVSMWYGLRKATSHPLIKPAYWYLVALATIQTAAVVLVGVTDLSALHLLWVTPVAIFTTAYLGYRNLKKLARKSGGMPFGVGPNPETAWRQILDQLEQQNRASSVVESRPKLTDNED